MCSLVRVSAMVVVLCNLGAVHLAPTGRLLSGYELSRLIRPNQLNTELAILEYGKGPNETHSRLSPSVAKLVNPGQQQVMVWLSFFKQLAAYVAMIISISFMFLAFFLVFLYLQHRHELKLDEVSVSTSVCNLKNIFFKRQALVKRYHRFAFAAGLPYHAVDPSTVSSTSSESYSPETLTKLVSKSSEMIAQHQARKNARGDLVHLSDTNIKYTTNKDCM